MGALVKAGIPEGTRTLNLWLRKPTPYPFGHKDIFVKKCHLLGSNQGPSDLQSDALPTELKRLCYACDLLTKNSTSSGDRTHDHKIKSLALYHLSYGGSVVAGNLFLVAPFTYLPLCSF